MPRPQRSILVSAGEASGDYYAAELVRELRRRWPACDFFGCAGPHLRYHDFVDYGDADAYRAKWKKLREELKP